MRGMESVRPRRSRVLPVIVAVVALLAGCVRQATTSGPAGDTMTITEEQIAQLHAMTAYDAVARLHGDFLVSRGRQSTDPNVPPTPPDVYLDNVFYGDVNRLRDIPAQDIAAIKLYQAYEAQYKFGSGHIGGVIQVLTKH